MSLILLAGFVYMLIVPQDMYRPPHVAQGLHYPVHTLA